ncbi:MAG TPA: NAD/NADP octopine/nopaline dehydrogenase family protein [Pseudolabrys sp.]|nr:NAD/NADP octopine/nopaline dehydrogenase family protein [Pseudolabrys sp.]
MRVAVLGAGAGGAAMASELCLKGHVVAFWGRGQETLAPFQQRGGVGYEGVLGSGVARPALITKDLSHALRDAEVAIVALPTFSHAVMARAVASSKWPEDRPILLNPGHTGGALEFSEAYRASGGAVPPIVEFSTLTYVARKYHPDCVTITSRAKCVRAAALPGGTAALHLASKLFPSASPVADVLAADLSNVNMILHPPGAVLAAAWIEARHGDFTFYVEAMTPGVSRVMQQLDDERRRVAQAFGHNLPNLVEEMQFIGTVENDISDTNDFTAAIRGGKANQAIRAPDSLGHRYYREDFGHGLLPFIEFAAIARIEVPVATALFEIGQAVCGTDFRQSGRTALAMGIAGLSLKDLMHKVTLQ